MGEIRYPLSFNQITCRDQWTLRQAIEACARHGVPGICPWRDKLAECGVKEAAKMIADAGLGVSGLCRGGMFPAADAAGRQAAIDDNLRAIDDAATIGADCLVMVCGGLPEGSKDIAGAREMVRDGLAAILPHARSVGMPLAIEPLHPMYAADRNCINTMAQANDLCDELGEGLGIAVDVYHVWWDPNLVAEVERAARHPKRIAAYHICDWLMDTGDRLTDRGMMGDGVIDLKGFRAMIEATGYEGFAEVEILSARWWAEDPDAVMRTCVERHATVC